MRLIPGTAVTVKLDGEKHHFVLVATRDGGDHQLSVAAPLAVLLGAMAVGDVTKGWTPPRVAEAEAMRVELMTVEMAQ